MKHAFAAAALALMLACPAAAQDVVRQGRYALVPHQDGFLRLDTSTGEVSRCTGEIGRLACRLLPDERMAYEEEIRRLEERISALEGRVAALQLPGEPRGEQPPDSADDLPSEEELDRVFSLMEETMRRLFDMARDLKEEYGGERTRP